MNTETGRCTDEAYKWKFAIGTTSRIPNRPGFHYLIADFDHHDIGKELEYLTGFVKINHLFLQRTNHGWHMYTDYIMSFRDICILLGDIADKAWASIGEKRGYFYLADKNIVLVPWPVERMIIHVEKGKGETFNSKRAG